MNRMLARLIPALALCLPALAFGQEKLLLTTVVVAPTQAETIAIYNPGTTTIDLSNYYVSDTSTYYKVVFPTQGIDGGTIAGGADFIVRFPPGATIAPGETQWIAVGGAECFKQPEGDAGVGSNGCTTGSWPGYGIYPTYEIASSTDSNAASVPDMVIPPGVTVLNGSSGHGITNSGEPIMLFWWDGTAALIVDVDYVYVGVANADGGTNMPVNKTGIVINGSAYQNDTIDGPLHRASIADGGGGVAGSCRKVPFTEANQIMTGGNGVNGSDETSEETANTWEECSVVTPTTWLPSYDAGVPEGLDAAEPGLDAAAPGLDAAEPGLDAAAPGLDAAEPGLDAAAPGLDAAAPGLDAAAPGLDAAAPGLDAAAPGLDAAAPGLDATVVIPPDAAAPALDAEVFPADTSVAPGPDAEVIAGEDAATVVGLDASTVIPPDASEEEQPDAAAAKKDAGKKADVGTTETTATGCSCGTTDGSGFASTSLFGMLALGLVIRRKRSA